VRQLVIKVLTVILVFRNVQYSLSLHNIQMYVVI